MWVLSRPCFQGKLATISYKTSTQKKKFLNEKTWPMLFFDVSETPKKFSHIFSNFWPIFRHLPPCLWLYLKKFLAKHFKIIIYQCTIANSNTDSLGLILDVEFFFLWVTVQEHCELIMVQVSESVRDARRPRHGAD